MPPITSPGPALMTAPLERLEPVCSRGYNHRRKRSKTAGKKASRMNDEDPCRGCVARDAPALCSTGCRWYMGTHTDDERAWTLEKEREFDLADWVLREARSSSLTQGVRESRRGERRKADLSYRERISRVRETEPLPWLENSDDA